MKIVIPGGTGHVGLALQRHFAARGDDVTIISRSSGVRWDGETLGDWAEIFEGADVVINLAGRTVNCRYNAENLNQMMQSRVRSARVVGEAIRRAKNPPKLWLQASTATIYAHRFDAPNDELTGIYGGGEPGSSPKWDASIEIAKAWEKELNDAETPHTRKVAMRSAMTMSADVGSVFDVFSRLARRGLAGTWGNGKQYVSWIHEHDFAKALDFVIQNESLEGPINFASPNPLPNKEFNQILRETWAVKIGLPAAAWMLEIGTLVQRTETELILKSRRVIPTRLLQAGFQFDYPEWGRAAAELKSRLT